MNKLLLSTVLTITLATLSITAQAKNSELQNVEIYHCELVADYARQAILLRYLPEPPSYAEMIEPVKDDYIAVWAVGQAIKQKYLTTEGGRKSQANRFGNKILLGCLDHKESRGMINL